MSTGNRARRRLIPVLCAALILLHGCATYTHISDADRVALRKVSILPADHLPVVDIEGIPTEKSSTTTEGAVAGALLGGFFAWGVAAAVCVGSMGTACVPAVGVAAGGTVAGGAIGGAAASGSATDTKGYAQQADAAEEYVQRLNIQSALATNLNQAAREAGRVELVAEDRSEVHVIAGIDRLIIDELGYLRIIGALKLHGLNDGPDTHDFEFLYLGAKKPADWVAHEGVAIDQALQRALPPIANRLVDEVAALDPDAAPLMLDAIRDPKSETPNRWHLGWKAPEGMPGGADVQLRLYPANAGAPCIDWLRRENYRDPSVCLPLPLAEPEVQQIGLPLADEVAEVDTDGTGTWTWIARQVWQTGEGERLSEWFEGPSLLPDGSTTDPSATAGGPGATIKVKPKMQFRVLWGNRVDCWLYEPELRSTHTAMRMKLEREVRAGKQVIGGVCSREHADILFSWGTPWTENEVTFWLEGDLQPGHRYRIQVAELKSNLNFRCVVLVDRESDEELDRFCIPAPADGETVPEDG